MRRSIWQNQHYSFDMLTDGTEVLTCAGMAMAMTIVAREQELRTRLEVLCLRRLDVLADAMRSQLRVVRVELFLRRALFLLHCLQHSELHLRLQLLCEEHHVRQTAAATARRSLDAAHGGMQLQLAARREAEHYAAMVKQHNERVTLQTNGMFTALAASAAGEGLVAPEQQFRRMQDQFVLRHGRLQHEANRSVWNSMSPEH